MNEKNIFQWISVIAGALAIYTFMTGRSSWRQEQAEASIPMTGGKQQITPKAQYGTRWVHGVQYRTSQEVSCCDVTCAFGPIVNVNPQPEAAYYACDATPHKPAIYQGGSEVYA